MLSDLRHRPLPSPLSLDYLCIDHSCSVSFRSDARLSFSGSIRADNLLPFVFGQHQDVITYRLPGLLLGIALGFLVYFPQIHCRRHYFSVFQCIFIITMVHEHFFCLGSVLAPFPLLTNILSTKQSGSTEIFSSARFHRGLLSSRLNNGLQSWMSDQS